MSNEPPPAPTPESNPARYFKLNSLKLTFREYWNIVHSWQVIIPWVAKLLRRRMKFSTGMPFFASVRELEIPEAEVPAEARAKLQPALDHCLQLDFHSPRFYRYESMQRDTSTFFIALLHRSGVTLRLMLAISTQVHPPKFKLTTVLLSELDDGTYFFTSNTRPQFLSPPGILANRLVGAGPDRLLGLHERKLAELAARNPARPVSSVQMLDQLWDKYEALTIEFGFKRGIYEWMPEEEQAAGLKKLETAKTMADAGTENVDVLLELDRLQNTKTGWGNAVIILVVSLAFFVGAGSRQWSWNYVLILVPVLFVHELGHYVAMRAFHYRNLRMFFIPFFGAAVSGQHYNVAGWKKVVVSLMGPVPGICLGVIVGGAGLILHHALLIKVAIVALILNGFNLLPVLPFDGGWVCHTLLFSRHHLLDTAFRVVAAIALLAGGFLSENKVLMYVSIPMFLSIPAAYRMARIATALRKRGLPPASSDDQTIPPETAQTIITELKKSVTKGHTKKMLAQETLQIFETLNARPPGWPATIGLFFAHVASFGMAAVFALIFIVGQSGDLRGFVAAAAHLPKHKLACGSTRAWQEGYMAEAAGGGAVTIVGTFAKTGDAARLFQDLTNRLPATATLRLFGDSVLLSLPADQDALRKQWLAEFQDRQADVFVESTNNPVMFSLSCLAPDVPTAESIVNELDGYFDTLEHLVPPWLPADSRPAETRAQHRLARQTYLALQKTEYEGMDDAGLSALEKKAATARKQGDHAEAKALSGQIAQLRKSRQQRNIEQVRSGAQGPVDTNVVELFSAMPATSGETNREDNAALQNIGRRMGQLPLANGHPSPKDDRYSAQMGMASRKGLLLTVPWVSFSNTIDGAPALAEWLCAQGFIDFRYELTAGMGRDDP